MAGLQDCRTGHMVNGFADPGMQLLIIAELQDCKKELMALVVVQ